MKEGKQSAKMPENRQFSSEAKPDKRQAPKDFNESGPGEKIRSKTILRKKGMPGFKSSHIR